MISARFLYPGALIALWAAIFVSTITRPALLDDADSFHAEAVREMVRSGDWVTFRIDNGIRYLEKAPFYVLDRGPLGFRFRASRLGNPAAPCAVLPFVDIAGLQVRSAVLGSKRRLLLGTRDCCLFGPLCIHPAIFARCDLILLYRSLPILPTRG